MIVFKSCPNCHGDIYVRAGQEPSCLQCGYEVPANEVSILQKNPLGALLSRNEIVMSGYESGTSALPHESSLLSQVDDT